MREHFARTNCQRSSELRYLAAQPTAPLRRGQEVGPVLDGEHTRICGQEGARRIAAGALGFTIGGMTS